MSIARSAFLSSRIGRLHGSCNEAAGRVTKGIFVVMYLITSMRLEKTFPLHSRLKPKGPKGCVLIAVEGVGPLLIRRGQYNQEPYDQVLLDWQENTVSDQNR
ncbi:hypothetical protein EYF80_054002 [Liparis tanakae]|uniref:Uncharacterized protein n=1 Tax=Liparis tanakae TaxID=230148 RepID=A0A4Z2F3W4_9TELE|nr:hypothetical protein EYF80_054002 [Liparis tanakae]